MELSRDEAVVSNDQNQIIKGKRTKRLRPPSPLALRIAYSTSPSAGDGEIIGGEGVIRNNSGDPDHALVSATISSAGCPQSTKEEEEDMANCLILLAQGSSSQKPTNSKSGFYVYRCLTCDRSFPSFQALGGHRASHKKLKPNNNNNREEKNGSYTTWQFMESKEEHRHDHLNKANTTLTLRMANIVSCSNVKLKIHECSICAAEFSSGQALGGHMRRHRSFTTISTNAKSVNQPKEVQNPRNGLSLDLNLPAPEEDHCHRGEAKISLFVPNEQTRIFSMPPLIDCHQ